jgi:hypothetical protein
MTSPRRRWRAAAAPPSPPDYPLLSRHRAFIRALPCAACGKPPPSECAHFGMPAGLVLPPSERRVVPLCGPASVWQDCCHSRKYFLGPARFWSGLGIDPEAVAARLWHVSGDIVAGEVEVRRARLVSDASRQHAREEWDHPNPRYQTQQAPSYALPRHQEATPVQDPRSGERAPVSSVAA